MRAVREISQFLPDVKFNIEQEKVPVSLALDIASY